MAAIPAPRRPNPLLRLGVAFSERVVHKRLDPARLLTWYPKAAIGFGVMESLVAHHDGRLDKRLLQVVRLTASLAPARVNRNCHCSVPPTSRCACGASCGEKPDTSTRAE